MTKSRTLLAAFTGAAFLAGGAMTSRADEAVPETQKVIIDNEFVRVLDIRVPPGVFEPKHSHARGVTVALSDYDNETKTLPNGKANKSHVKFGEVKWAEPVTHEARNTGSTEQRVIRIELKKEAPPSEAAKPDPLDSLVICGESEKLIFENAYVRAIDNVAPAGNLEKMHTHPHGVTVALSEYENKTTLPDGKVSSRKTNKFDVRFVEATKHEVLNVGGTAEHAIRIDLKQ